MIILVNKTDIKGGAAVACKRLATALKKNGLDVKMLVQQKKSSESEIYTTTNTLLKKLVNIWRFLFERIIFIFYEKSKDVRFLFSIGNTGEFIHNHQLIKQADVIHLHWIHQGFLSIKSLKKLFNSGKPVIWTLHDMWAFTGGCHHAIECINYQSECRYCPYLKNPGREDLSHKVWTRKKRIMENQKLTIIACSKWLKECASSSSLLRGQDIRTIPNPVDHTRYIPSDKEMAKKRLGLDQGKKYILFGAPNVRSIFKGFPYFLDAINKFISMHDTYNLCEVLLYGKATADIISLIPMVTHDFAYIELEEKMINLYNAADVTVISSLQENLPNTIMESFACGTPVVGFNTGGIGEMIDHKRNGYLAAYKSSVDLANGIKWVLDHDNYHKLSVNARQKVLNEYSEEIVTEKYRKVYEELLKS